ncbi:class I SAM-dependent methyltransferase [Ferruginivarius sediminum]|nr:methyltransferase domain-containing protein [Ferruginivarius sediminum]
MTSQTTEIGLFLRRWLAHPLRVGAIMPSSRALARLVARNAVTSPDDTVVELGAGTGTVTRALVEAGLDEGRLVLIELDRDLVAYLRRRFPSATVIEGDASRPYDILPRDSIGKVDTVISGIPALQFPLEKQRQFIGQCFAAMRADGQLLQYTYSLASPLPTAPLKLSGKRLGLAFANVPPAHLWGYTPLEGSGIGEAAAGEAAE